MNKRSVELMVGGLVAVGFDATGRYVLVVSHSGRGVFRVGDWERVARDRTVVYPEAGRVAGIGPLEGEVIAVAERDLDADEEMMVRSADEAYELVCRSDGIEVRTGEKGR